MTNEEQLSERIRQGDRRAQQELYERMAGTAMAVAMRYVADVEAAHDVLQEAFVKVLTRMDRFDYRGEGSLRAWVMRVVSNEALSYLHQQRRHPEGPPLDSVADVVEDEAEEPDIGGVPTEALQRMIEALPEGYRLVFNLYVFEQKSHKEIARLMGIKENSSASQFHRAKLLLTKMIKDYKQRQA